ncbi:MAG: MFS transporter [Acidimicrobiales bacterium]
MTQPANVGSDERTSGEVRWPVLVVTGLAIFTFGVDTGLVSVSLADIEESFPDASRATISWVSTGYAVASVALLLIAGRLGDRYGRRLVFEAGLWAIGIGAVIAAIAPEVLILIAGRILGGAGGALCLATGLAISLREAPANRKAMAVGFWGFMGSVGFVLGPTGGGLVIEALSWRWAFLFMAPLAFVGAVAARRVLPESSDPETAGPINIVEIPTATIGVGALALGLSQSGRWGLDDPRVIALVVLGLTLLTVLVARSGRPGSLVDRRLWRFRPYVIATAGASIQQFGFLPWFVTTGFVLREVWGWSALQTGWALSLGMLVAAPVNVIGGRVADRVGYVRVTNAGAVLAGCGALFWVVTMDAEPDFWGVYVPGLALFMLGAGVAGLLPTGAALQDIPRSLLGVANATHSTLRRLAASMGLAIMAALLGEEVGDALLPGVKSVYTMVAVAHFALIPFMWAYGRATRNRDSAVIAHTGDTR